jgi:hypothetical protein
MEFATSVNNDTGGQFVQDIRGRGFSPHCGPILPKVRPADCRREFATSVNNRVTRGKVAR